MDPTKRPRPGGIGPRVRVGGVIGAAALDDDREQPHADDRAGGLGALDLVLQRSPSARAMLEGLEELARARVRWSVSQELARAAAQDVERARARMIAAAPRDFEPAEIALLNAQHDARRWTAEASFWRTRVDRLEQTLLHIAELSA